ncbi:MAG: TorF family putative porin [Oleibacter sp.]|nr:TorF family putative porin [Thalassolituus sp.]
MKKLTKAIALIGAVSAASFAQAEDMSAIDISASATVASMYLWRGQDLGNGAAAVSGDITASVGGAYAGVWTSSGDSTYGNEYDLYVGYGGEVSDFSYDLSFWTYSYPGSDAVNGEGNTFDLTDFIVSLGYMGASFSYYYPVGSAATEDYSYMTLGYGMDAYSITVGIADDEGSLKDYTHVDLGYAYNDSLSFTVSKIVDKDDDGSVDDDVRIAVSYSLPISM